MSSISSSIIEAWLRRCAQVFTQHKDELTDLDAKIGDADHGVNMVSVVLRVIVFNNNSWAVNSVIMRIAQSLLLGPRPRKPQLIHIHTVIRDLKNDFGGDELMEHYRSSRH
jgi:hypothetical protein